MPLRRLLAGGRRGHGSGRAGDDQILWRAQKAVQGSKIIPKGILYYGTLGVIVFALPVIYFGVTMNSNDYTEDQLHGIESKVANKKINKKARNLEKQEGTMLLQMMEENEKKH